MQNIECFADLLDQYPIPADVINEKGDVKPEDEIIGQRDECVIAEGRIRRRRHGHDRSWGERYGDFRPRSVLVLSTRQDVFNTQEHIGMTADIGPDRTDGTEVDWESLKRANAGWHEPTIASIASPEIKQFATEVLLKGLAKALHV